jgi:hypothetical protein
MSFIVTKNGPSTADLRAWGNENGFPAKDETRGRPSKALILAYNAKHKGANAYVKGGHTKAQTLTVKPAKGRAKAVKVSVPQARAALLAQGVKVGERGRLPKAAMESLLNGTIKA